ncbi:MAG: radical SAM protein [Deltaproteobacteria bacterium]|nr:radical SAM protein [Deltaproteobacteria bacterium]
MSTESSHGQSLCPHCLALIPARYEHEGDQVFQVKQCPEHGVFRTVVWRGEPAFASWRRPKIPAQLTYHAAPAERGCPFDCGLCPEHRQRTCTAILEVTQRCDLGCPVCYADSCGQGEDPSLEQVESWYRAVLQSGSGCNIQLSGGEPTLRDDLPQLVVLGRELGFGFVQVNTNGLRLGREPDYLHALTQAGMASIFLQFDGVEDRVYEKLRGRALLADKLRVLDACARAGVGVVLVPTLVPGVNLDQVGPILDLAQERSPTVRGVHFQPMSRFGRFPSGLGDDQRLTLPELIQAIDQQTSGRFPAESFRPPGCENSLCSFQGNFLLHNDGRVQSLSQAHDPACCPAPEPAEQGALRTIARVSRNWAAPTPSACGCDAPKGDGPLSLDQFIDMAKQGTLSVSAMAFQDAWNLDLDRVRDCCIHVVSPQGKLIPFCLYNLTSSSGERLYRP